MITRRHFIRTIGKGSTAIALIGVAACSAEEPAPVTLTAAAPTTTTLPTTASGASSTTSIPETPTTEVAEPGLFVDEWHRVNLGFVSAYILVRGGEAALIDTGTSGSASQVESTLGDLGLGWTDLSTIVLTHHHGDHVGSLPAIMQAATSATAHAGAEDIPNITSPRPISAVADGDTVFGLEVVATPGHTAGHISLLDPVGATLIAGDAMVGENGGVAGPPAQFTADPETADASIVKLGGLDFEVIYFGHGEPVTIGGSAQVAELAAGL
jgi:glyoxylase-like metal-dependent hydrolase (beta-lactamase superfamily II)